MRFADFENLPNYFTPIPSNDALCEAYIVNPNLVRDGKALRYQGKTIRGAYHNEGNDYFTLQIEHAKLVHLPLARPITIDLVSINYTTIAEL